MTMPKSRFTYRCGALVVICSALFACSANRATQDSQGSETEALSSSSNASVSASTSSAFISTAISKALVTQTGEVKARYPYRNPGETLTFFGIKPGMTVVEALPGGGWYSKILLPVLGSNGQLIGANYAPELWPNFNFTNDEFLARQKTWTTDWPAGAEEWRTESSAGVSAFVFSQLPQSMHATADAVLFIRALHNMARFDTAFLDQAIQDSFDILKPGGIVGIVQHEARPDMPDEWADGSAGYLKKTFVIARMEAAGFEYVGESDINNNPADRPTTDDIVWRLPPSLATSREDEALKATLQAVGESHRMTLKFAKPGVS